MRLTPVIGGNRQQRRASVIGMPFDIAWEPTWILAQSLIEGDAGGSASSTVVHPLITLVEADADGTAWPAVTCFDSQSISEYLDASANAVIPYKLAAQLLESMGGSATDKVSSVAPWTYCEGFTNASLNALVRTYGTLSVSSTSVNSMRAKVLVSSVAGAMSVITTCSANRWYFVSGQVSVLETLDGYSAAPMVSASPDVNPLGITASSSANPTILSWGPSTILSGNFISDAQVIVAQVSDNTPDPMCESLSSQALAKHQVLGGTTVTRETATAVLSAIRVLAFSTVKFLESTAAETLIFVYGVDLASFDSVELEDLFNCQVATAEVMSVVSADTKEGFDWQLAATTANYSADVESEDQFGFYAVTIEVSSSDMATSAAGTTSGIVTVPVQ